MQWVKLSLHAMLRVERQSVIRITQRYECSNYAQPPVVATAADMAEVFHLSLSGCFSSPISRFCLFVISLQRNKLGYAATSLVGTLGNLSW